METIQQYIQDMDGFFWAVVIGVLTPLAIVILNELLFRTNKNYKQLEKPINAIKNIIVPFGAAMIVLVQVLDVQRDNTLVKVLETALWTFVINALIAIANALYFSKDGEEGQSRKIPQLFLDISRVALVLVGIAIVLSSVWGADLSGLATALGLGSFVLGLALQDTLGNLFSGIALVYE